jgi:copper chaperone NosL
VTAVGRPASRDVGRSGEPMAVPDLPASRPAGRPTGGLQSSSRYLLLGAALSLLIAYLTPIWHIGLKAPQYPEGLGMYIWVSRITGEKPQDLNSINGLNHYIGMKPIEPESIPELQYMPIALAVLAGLGVAVALVGRRRLLYAWAALFAVSAVAGLADFWAWGYDYGHNLNPRAAIQVPGMSYQPPLLGNKQLLNFQATSWPALGGWVILAALLVVLAIAVQEWRFAARKA